MGADHGHCPAYRGIEHAEMNNALKLTFKFYTHLIALFVKLRLIGGLFSFVRHRMERSHRQMNDRAKQR